MQFVLLRDEEQCLKYDIWLKRKSDLDCEFSIRNVEGCDVISIADRFYNIL